MSFASILGPSNNEPPPKATESKPSRPRTPSPVPVEIAKLPVKRTQTPEPAIVEPSRPYTNGESKPHHKIVSKKSKQNLNIVPSKPRKLATDAEADRILKAIAIIDDAHLSDVEDHGWYEMKENFKRRSRKRAADIEEDELSKRKVCNAHFPPYIDDQANNDSSDGAHSILRL